MVVKGWPKMPKMAMRAEAQDSLSEMITFLEPFKWKEFRFLVQIKEETGSKGHTERS